MFKLLHLRQVDVVLIKLKKGMTVQGLKALSPLHGEMNWK
jgi:hypothetical protein